MNNESPNLSFGDVDRDHLSRIIELSHNLPFLSHDYTVPPDLVVWEKPRRGNTVTWVWTWKLESSIPLADF